MAKAGSKITAAEHKLEEFAEDLGTMLGHARTKAEGWMGQRQAIVKSLTELRDEASKLLSQLGHDAAAAGRRGRRAVGTVVAGIKRGPGGRPGSDKAIIIVSGKPRRKMSAKARAAISAAQKKRWAKQKAGAK